MTSSTESRGLLSLQREHLKAAARAFTRHFNDPVRLCPKVFGTESLWIAAAFHAQQYAADLQAVWGLLT